MIRRIVVSCACLMSMAVSASAAPLIVPSDSTAKYFLLEEWDGAGWALLLIKREGPNGVHFFQRDYECLDRTVSYAGEADSMQALRTAKTGPFRVRIREGSVDHDIWIEACGRQTSEQKQAAERRAALDKRLDLEERIRGIRPVRREHPLRSANITDDEVRQIQAVANQKLPGAIVNIGGVASGCPCEDGPSCSDQVWIVAHRPDQSRGLLLSKIDDHWIVGPVQQWWLDYEALETRPGGLSTQDEDEMTDRFPKCAAQPAAAKDAAARPARH